MLPVCLWDPSQQQGCPWGYTRCCTQIFIYPSQAGEDGEFPLKSSKPNGFHRIFHHESVWGGKGEGEEGSIVHLIFVIVWP